MDHALENEALPAWHRVCVRGVSAPALNDVAAATLAAMRGMPLDGLRGAGVAVACGSRGIANYAVAVRAVVDDLRARGAAPFIVPAMGSHGGATAEAQAEVLAAAGIDEARMGVPVISSMDTVSTGITPGGVEVFADRNAFEGGRILIVNRVKQHTSFRGRHESGLLKMIAVGLGKLDGARRYHAAAMRLGFHQALLEMARQTIASGRILGGVALVENDRHQTAEVAAIPAAHLEEREAELLDKARRWQARLPFRKLDLLVVDEIGKEISGTGMDSRVVGRSVHPELDGADGVNAIPGDVRIRRIYVRDLTDSSHGNATGVGLADVVHARVAAKMDFAKTYTNVGTSLSYRIGMLPVSFPSDRAALNYLLRNLGSPAPETLRAVWIRNTLELSDFRCTPACLSDLADDPRFEIGPAETAALAD